MKKQKLSLCIITKDEEQNIARCIDSVGFADEIVVLDSGSTDKTQEIAEQKGAKVFVEKWRGFCGQKNRLSELASNDWILNLDADEALSPELAKEIEELFEKDSMGQFSAFRMPRKSYHLGKWISHGGWYPDPQIRLYNKNKSRWEGGALHEHIVSVKTGRLNSKLLHWVFKDLDDQIAANNRYSKLGAEVLLEKGKNFSFIMMLIKPWSKFIETYFFKRGFLDGMAGFVISVGAAYSMFLKYAKLYYLKQKNK